MSTSISAEEYKAQLLERLKVLTRQEEEIANMIESVDISLLDLGYQVSNPGGKAIIPQTGIQINNKLSFRGQQMAEEYFKYIDNDADAYLNFEDIRAMKAFSSPNGIVHEPAYSNWESFRLYLEDNNIAITKRGEISMESFVKYRVMIEPEQPLSRELEYLNLGFLPSDLALWGNLKRSIKNLLAYRYSIMSNLQRNDYDPSDGTVEKKK